MGLYSIPFYSIIYIYVFWMVLLFNRCKRMEVRSFFMSYFWMSPPFLHNYYIMVSLYLQWYYCIIFAFCSRFVNIIADIFVLHRVFVYISWTFYKIQNIQNTKFFADSELQNTKFILFLDKIFFLEHLKCPLFKVKSFNFVNKWLIQQIRQ